MSPRGSCRSRWPGLLLLAASVLAPAHAQDSFQVNTTVDARRIGLQDTLEYKIEVNGAGFTTVEPPDLGALRDFEVLDGPRRVQRQSIVNGRFSAAVDLLWTLGPRRTGRLTIPSLALRVDDAGFRTDPVDVQVVEGSVATRVPSSGRRREQSGEVLLVAELDRTRAYVGQQVGFTLKILTQMGIRGMAYQSRPDFSGFWAERDFDFVDEPPSRIDGGQVERDGKQYNEYELAHFALFPTASGTVEIAPITLQLRVRGDRGDRFGSFFFDREQTVLRRTAPLQVEVLPLPGEGRPVGFSGAVGEFRLEVATDRESSVVNDAVALSVRVSGTGNIRAAGEPELPALADFRPFDPTVTETQGFEGGVFRGSRTWEYVLLPLAPGEQAIPPIAFSYFDPVAGDYRTLRSDAVPLHIARGEGPELPRGAGLTRREVTALGEDIHFIRLGDGDLRDRTTSFHRSGAYLALLAMPFLLNGALLAWRLRTDRLRADVARRRALGARRAFRSALAEAASARRQRDAVGFHGAVSRAVTGLLGDRFNLAAAGLTRDRIREVLTAAGAAEELRSETQSVLDACDAARFAPSSVSEGAMEELLARAESLGVRLEKLR
ncbi:MAG: BatD family protein [Acidobacteriota bacterium]